MSVFAVVDMPGGVCKLCLKPSDLQDSHLIGRAIYAMSRDKLYSPVVMTPKLATHTSRQVHDFVFCKECEDRFNKGGEGYVSGMVCNGSSFPLLDRIRLALPGKRMENQGVQYSGKALGINTDKLAYYAVSIVWRAAVHRWNTLDRQKTSVEMTDERLKQLRLFLMGHIGFPADIGVLVVVCVDMESQGFSFTPTKMHDEKLTSYAMLINGIYFQVMMDIAPRFPFHEVCCIHSPGNVIFVGNRAEETSHWFGLLKSEARVARNLKVKKTLRASD